MLPGTCSKIFWRKGVLEFLKGNSKRRKSKENHLKLSAKKAFILRSTLNLLVLHSSGSSPKKIFPCMAIAISKILEHVYMRSEVNSNRFVISNRFEMSFPLQCNLHRDFTEASFQTIARPYWPKWNLHQSEFHYARSHVNADNEVTSNRSEILSRIQISNRFEFTSGLT